MNKLRFAISLFLTFILILITPLQTLAIILEFHHWQAWEEIQANRFEWDGDNPTLQEAATFLDALYENNHLTPQGTDTDIPELANQQIIEASALQNNIYEVLSLDVQSATQIVFGDNRLYIPENALGSTVNFNFHVNPDSFSLEVTDTSQATVDAFERDVVLRMPLELSANTEFIVYRVSANGLEPQLSTYSETSGELTIILSRPGDFRIIGNERRPMQQTSGDSVWRVGDNVGLPYGKLIRQGQGFDFPYHTCVPEDDWLVRVIGGPRFADGYTWYNIDRRVLDELPTSGTGWVAFEAVDILEDCDDTPPIGDIWGPTIELLSVYASPAVGDSTDLAIQVYVSDDIGVASVTLEYGGLVLPMTPVAVDAAGVGVYEGILLGVPFNEPIVFNVTAVDVSGNTTSITYQYFNGRTTRLGLHQCYQAQCEDGRQTRYPCCNPVTTDTGNKVEIVPVIAYPGPGAAAINFELTYNSQSSLVGYFGSGFMSPVDMSLGIFDNALFTGVRVTYADGHTADFSQAGVCVFEPLQPDIYDTLACSDAGGYRLTTVYREIYDFDTNGRIIAFGDLNENQVEVLYEGNLPTALISDTGRQLEFVFDGDRIIEIQGTGDRTVLFEYTGLSLSSMTDARSGVWQFVYEERPNWYLLTQVITPENRSKNYQEYDEDGRVTFQRIGDTATYQILYAEDPNTTTIIDANDNMVVHEYDDEGRIISLTNGSGAVQHFSYTNFIRTGWIDGNGNEWVYTADDAGNRQNANGPLGFHEEWTYNDFNQVTTYLDSEGRLTQITYDERGNAIEIMDPQGNRHSITPNERGQAIEINDFSGRTTTFVYDDTTGDLLSSTDGEGHTTTYTYYETGLLETISYPNGNTFTYQYDENDNITTITGPLSWSVGYRYDADDNLIEAIDPLGGSETYAFDTSGRLVTICNALDNCVEYGYEPMGNLERISDALGRIVMFEFDGEYRVIQTLAPLGVVYETVYDAVGNPVLQIDPEGMATKAIFDALNRPIEVIANFIESAGETADTNVRTFIAYDLADNITSITDAESNSTTFTYNDLNQMVQVEDALQRSWFYDYLPTGEISRVENARSAVTSFDYDNNGRLIGTTDAENNITAYIYDGNSNLIAMSNARGVITRLNYDALDRLVERIENYLPGVVSDSETNVSTQFEYNLRDDLIAMTDGRNHTAHFEYDAISRLTRTVDRENAETDFLYDDVDNLIAYTDDNDNTTFFVYDNLDRVIGVINPEIHVREMTYDKVGNLVTLTNERHFLETRTYDGLHRLVQTEDFEQGIWQYEYDRVSNLVAANDANEHRTTFNYNAVYELISTVDPKDILRTYEYDAVSNLTRYVDGNSNATTFGYDLIDRLIWQENALGYRTQFTYDAVSNLTAQIAADDVVTRYEYDPLDRLSAVVENFLPTEPHTNETNVTTSYLFDPNGNLTGFINPNGYPTRFEHDAENRVIREIDALNNISEYDYDGVGNMIERVDAENDRTQYRYYPDNMLAEQQYPDNSGTRYFYDETNNLTRMEEVRRNLGDTLMTYDGLNRQTSVTDALGRTLSMQYDPVGNRIGLIYPDDRNITYAYDPNDWLASATISSQGTTAYTRDNEGFITEQINPNNTVSTMTYDAVNQMLSIRSIQTDNNPTLISATQYVYDGVGMRSQVTSEYGWRQPTSVTTDYTYDPLRRLRRAVDTERIVTAYHYDAAGNRLMWRTNDNPTTQIPFDAFTEYFEYNEINQLVQAERTHEDGALPIHTPEPLSSTPIVITPLAETNTPETLAIVEADSSTEIATEELLPEMTEIVTEEVETTIAETEIVTVEATTETPDVTTTDIVTETESPTAEVTLEPTTETVTVEATTETVTPEITDLATEVTESPTDEIIPEPTTETVTAEATTETVTVEPTTETATDKPEDATATTPPPTIATTEPPVVTTQPPVTEATTEAPTEPPVIVTTAVPIPTIDDLLQSLNVACNELPPGLCNSLTQKVENAANSVSQNDYSAATQELRTFVQQVNNQSQVNPATRAQLTALANELISYYESLMYADDVQYVGLGLAGGLPEQRGNPNYPDSNDPRDYIATFEYDANGSRVESLYHYGNQTTLGSEYGYDYERRLNNVNNFRIVGPIPSRVNGTGRRQYDGITTYTYDSFGTLLQDTFSQNTRSREFTTEYLADGWDIVGEYNTLNGQDTYFYRDDTQQLMSSEHLWIGGNGADSWYHHDGLGSVTGLTKHIGQSVHNYRYDEYGAVIPATGNFLEPHNDFTFTGKPFDSDTGLQWFGSRHYDSLTAQWMQQDTFRGVREIPQSLHRYGYVHGSPTNYMDSYGYFGNTRNAIFGAAISGVANVAKTYISQLYNHAESQLNSTYGATPSYGDNCDCSTLESTIYINGITTGLEAAGRERDKLSEELNNTRIELIYNPSTDEVISYSGQPFDVKEAFGHWETSKTGIAQPDDGTRGKLMAAIQARLDCDLGITVIGFSEGAAISAAAHRLLRDKGYDVSRIHYITLGGAASEGVQFDNSADVCSIADRRDPVPFLTRSLSGWGKIDHEVNYGVFDINVHSVNHYKQYIGKCNSGAGGTW